MKKKLNKEKKKRLKKSFFSIQLLFMVHYPRKRVSGKRARIETDRHHKDE